MEDKIWIKYKKKNTPCRDFNVKLKLNKERKEDLISLPKIKETEDKFFTFQDFQILYQVLYEKFCCVLRQFWMILFVVSMSKGFLK